jgi:mRNA interferase MazF
MLALDSRQQDLLKTFKETINEKDKNEINYKSNININETEDKIIHSNFNREFKSREVIMEDKINYNYTSYSDLTWGDVVYLNLDSQGIGSEQTGIRYGIIIQNPIGTKFSPTIIVALLTSRLTKAKLPLVHVEIPAGKFGLPKDSVVLLEQIRTLDKKRIIKRVGRLDEETSVKIENALSNSTDRNLGKTKILNKLDKQLENEINEMLEDILIYEKAISRSKNESLINNLLEQREAFLWSLQKLCEDNNLNYKDYYKMYKKEDEKMVV